MKSMVQVVSISCMSISSKDGIVSERNTMMIPLAQAFNRIQIDPFFRRFRRRFSSLFSFTHAS